MTELKPCAYCGGEPYNVPQTCSYSAPGKQHFYRILCKNCAADTPPQSTPEAAIAFWNTRASPHTDGDDGELVERLKLGDLSAIDQAAARITALSAEVAAYERSIVLKQELIEALSAEVERLRNERVADSHPGWDDFRATTFEAWEKKQGAKP